MKSEFRWAEPQHGRRKHELLNLARLRERKVVRGLFRGLKNSEIAKEYGIPKSTLRQIVARLCARYDITVNDGLRSETNRIKLIVRLFNAGLCPCTKCRSNRGGRRAAGETTTSEHAFDIELGNGGNAGGLEDSNLRRRKGSRQVGKVQANLVVSQTVRMESTRP